jgi:hypothetical protein
MSNADLPIHRRQLLLGAFTVLVHLVVFHWIVVQAGKPGGASGQFLVPQLVTQLVQAKAPPPLPPQPVAPPQPQLALPPLPRLAPEPVEVAQSEQAPADGPAGPDDALGGPGPGPGQSLRMGAAAAAPAEAPPPAAPPPPAPPARRYKIDLPPAAEITLDVLRVDADGARWHGQETLSWTLDKDSYRIRIEAGIKVMFANVNLLTLTSEGKLGDEGFTPTLMTEKRRGKSVTATHFGRDTNLLTFSASEARYGLQPYMQDKASLPLELAAIARGDPHQLTGNLSFLVGEDRDASVFDMTVAGMEALDTRLGKISALHLVRPPKPGSYSARLDIWLAPDYGWYPVQVRNVEANGATTTQTVSSIVTNKGAGS